MEIYHGESDYSNMPTLQEFIYEFNSTPIKIPPGIPTTPLGG